MVYGLSKEAIQYTPLKESALEMSLSDFRQRPRAPVPVIHRPGERRSSASVSGSEVVVQTQLL